MMQKKEMVTANRNVYHEVERKNQALSLVKKQLEESRLSAQRMSLMMENLRRCTARFLTKLTKSKQGVPSNHQLQEMIHKLNEELSRLVKQIASTLIKDGQASASLADGDVSEMLRLQKMPGFSSVTRA
eukprot:CAMPEP_0198440598 /NCGR_PEP_ID=MMETSP1452-20131203/59456_1 /TAXON_ID=1181717 /ORGANISM="Synchroma pusillum, Strain CCMP3072" /LENGTH=128 /DNA_ID=CAMNT_0044161215 /DNA_START=30 /DNA_END=413 /DNA_ORIENTATION=-